MLEESTDSDGRFLLIEVYSVYVMSAQVIPGRLAAVAGEVAKLLKGRKETISVVETAAGGLVSAALLATPGASVSTLVAVLS